MSSPPPDRHHVGDYDREAHDRREIRRRLAMTPAERVRENAAIYRLWVIGRKRHAEKVAWFSAHQKASEQ